MFRRQLPMSSLLFAAAALVCALAAVALMRGYARRLEAAHPTLGAPVTVQVATRAVARGTQLTPDMLRSRQIPSTFVPPAALTDADQLVGRTLAADVAAGDVVTRTRLAGTRTGPIAALVPPGWRAFPIPSTLPAGAVAAGDLVDVLGAFAGAGSHVETVASGVEVARILAAAGTPGIEGAAPSGPSLVLLVDPDTARQLAYAQAFAKLVVTVDAPERSPEPSPEPS